MRYWESFILFFAIFSKSLWFVYYSSLYLIKPKTYKNFKGKTCLIIPCYNEDEDKLDDTLKHAIKTKGINQIITINDGSKNNCIDIMNKYKDKIIVIDLKKNQGKRIAQYEGIKRSNKDTDVFIMMDSDTILNKDSIIELLKPMSDDSIAGTTAQILVRNKNENFLTKCVSSMYWCASNIWRKAQSNYGFTQVTNGQLSCYKAKYIRELMNEYINQKFMGVNCTLSDDRWITHKLQTRYKKKIVYSENAIAYTYIPNTIKQSYKMFKRWELGSIRESILVLKDFKKNPLLVIDVWANKLIHLMQTIVRISIIIMAFFNPMIIVHYLLIMLVISSLFSYHMIWNNFKEFPYKLAYTILNEFIFGWKTLDACINIKNQNNWSTR